MFVVFSETQCKQGFQQPKLAIFSGMPAFHLLRKARHLFINDSETQENARPLFLNH